MTESFVFVYLGFSAFNYYSSHWCWGFIAWMIVIVLLARLIHIYLLSGLFKL
jgi:NhaP-type Na+/H+ or K+/H+ antiporter